MGEYGSSSQKRHWLVESEQDLLEMRQNARKLAKAPESEKLSVQAELGFLNVYLDQVLKLCKRKEINGKLADKKYVTQMYWVSCWVSRKQG